MPPPNADKLRSMDDLCLSENVRQKELYDELEWLKDLPEINLDDRQSQLPDEDTRFSQYLRFGSPSRFSAQGIGGHHDGDGGIHSQTVIASDICL